MRRLLRGFSRDFGGLSPREGSVNERPPTAIFGVPISTLVGRDELKHGIADGKWKPLDLTDVYDESTVAGLIKMFVREIPGGVIPSEEFNQLKGMMECMARLPPENLEFLQYLLRFLQRVTTFEASNKMGVSNLAIVFAPNCLQLDNSVDVLKGSMAAGGVMEFLLRNADGVCGIAAKSRQASANADASVYSPNIRVFSELQEKMATNLLSGTEGNGELVKSDAAAKRPTRRITIGSARTFLMKKNLFVPVATANPPQEASTEGSGKDEAGDTPKRRYIASFGEELPVTGFPRLGPNADESAFERGPGTESIDLYGASPPELPARQAA
ncbi:MAG: Rho GTPase activation protein, partial [Olpidium bornovanus]